jgi:hypothetical protein
MSSDQLSILSAGRKKPDMRFVWLLAVAAVAPGHYTRVAIVYASHADYDTGCNSRPAYATVAGDAGVNLRTVKRAVKWMEKGGWLARGGRYPVIVNGQPTRQTVVIYHLTTPNEVTPMGVTSISSLDDDSQDVTKCHLKPNEVTPMGGPLPTVLRPPVSPKTSVSPLSTVFSNAYGGSVRGKSDDISSSNAKAEQHDEQLAANRAAFRRQLEAAGIRE